jgi:hypothetical protein
MNAAEVSLRRPERVSSDLEEAGEERYQVSIGGGRV